MAVSKQFLRFRVSARMQKLIGEELVSNEEMAFLELVKNSYDSGATKLTITVQTETANQKPYILLEDNGEGMNLVEFERLYMFAGYSERDKPVGSGRVPTGEKGIGRFASDKIGEKLEVKTKKRGDNETLHVTFDWTEFMDRSAEFGDILVPYSSAKLFNKDWHGTTLKIEQLRSRWDPVRVEKLRTAITTLLNPYRPDNSFAIIFRVQGLRPSESQLVPEKPVRADYELQFKVGQDGRAHRKFRSPKQTQLSDWKPIAGTGSLISLAGVRGRILYYLKKPPRAWVHGLEGGVQLYRDGFLMQPFGSPLADRLGLWEARAKRAGHAPLVPNRLFGFVEVSRTDHPGLRDTTSRQEMLETPEMYDLIRFLRIQNKFLEENLVEEFTLPSWRESGREKAIELERARLNSLGNLSIGIGHEIRQPLQVILADVDAIALRMEELGIADNEVSSSIQSINDSAARIDETITFIKKLATGDLDDIATFDVASTIRKEVKVFAAQNSDVDFQQELPKAQMAVTNETTVIHVLANLLRNAVEALSELEDQRKPFIRVELSKLKHSTFLKVTDNAMGIPKDVIGKIFSRFATKKTGGLGFGLSYCRTIVQAQGGEITFETEEGVGTTFRVNIPNKNMES